MIITVEFPTLKKLCVRNLISPPVKAETKRTKLEEFMQYHSIVPFVTIIVQIYKSNYIRDLKKKKYITIDTL